MNADDRVVDMLVRRRYLSPYERGDEVAVADALTLFVADIVRQNRISKNEPGMEWHGLFRGKVPSHPPRLDAIAAVRSPPTYRAPDQVPACQTSAPT